MSLKGKKIIIGITGSIAAYKIPFLIRLLIKEGAEVQVLITPAARDFVTPLTLSTLSLHPVICEGFSASDGRWNSHVELGNWADLYLLAPLTANTMGKMVNGLADNLVIATYLAARCPVYFAPAMDVDMYNHPSTQENIRKLQSYGNILIQPQVGELASGLCGEGRLEEPEKIVRMLREAQKKKASLKGKNILITAGPTFEAIDPVRYIGNHSSGTMGFELAREAAERGAGVTLIAGPVSQNLVHPSVQRIDVVTAADMHKAVLHYFKKADITIMAAAVADYTPAKKADEKIKKHAQGKMILELTGTADILSDLGRKKKNKQILVGFALETNDEKKNALAKLKTKNLDMIVLNSLKDTGAGFGYTTNKVKIFHRSAKSVSFTLKPKKEVAADIINEIEKII
jgi:phosphopantothenoylcysteine decarboxylase / phosphopantothenate---cysteine ligase